MLVGCEFDYRPDAPKKPQGNDIGHCFIAIDPGLFRDREEFTADVTRFCNDLRATKPVEMFAMRNHDFEFISLQS